LRDEAGGRLGHHALAFGSAGARVRQDGLDDLGRRGGRRAARKAATSETDQPGTRARTSKGPVTSSCTMRGTSTVLTWKGFASAALRCPIMTWGQTGIVRRW
jgi:hypothetical protein